LLERVAADGVCFVLVILMSGVHGGRFRCTPLTEIFCMCITRRQALQHASALSAGVLLAPSLLRAVDHELSTVDGPSDAPLRNASSRKYYDVARKAASWIAKCRIETANGVTWPSDPQDPNSVSHGLYGGTPGIVLFYLELHRASGNAADLAEATAGAGELSAASKSASDEKMGAGLYLGWSGIGYTLTETYLASRDAKHRAAALDAWQQVVDTAKPQGKGVAWSDTTDIISGTAGTALALLYADRVLQAPGARDTAIKAGNTLLSVAEPAEGGLRWRMDPKFARVMPNFSHGTAGISYTLATLYEVSKDKAFLDAALKGAEHLQTIANVEGDQCLIEHHDGDGKQLYYLGWCHGPTGTARLFHRLAKVTGDATWNDWVAKAARGVSASGIPEHRTPGFWNNISVCCGDAGVAQFFLDLHRATKNDSYLAFGRRMMDDLISRGTEEGSAVKWIQAEHRVKPDELVAQTGLMQGAAGAGLVLLNYDAFDQKRKARIQLPDSPFGA
jgi:lantibiotic modifying enzyme